MSALRFGAGVGGTTGGAGTCEGTGDVSINWTPAGRPERLAVRLGIAAAIFGVVSFAIVLLRRWGYDGLPGLLAKFRVDFEQSVPTVFSAALLATAAMLFFAIADASEQGANDVPSGRHWRGLGLLFAVFAVDELSSFHELLTEPLRERLETGGLLYYAWVIPGAAFVVAAGAVFARFIRTLPQFTQRLMVTAGCLYVGGALGVELLGGWAAESRGPRSIVTLVFAHIEEGMEMLGAIVLIYALLHYMRDHVGPVAVDLWDSTVGP